MQRTQLTTRPGQTGEIDGNERKTVGDFVITYRTACAEGAWHFSAGKLEWKEPQEENAHLDVFIYDAKDGRFVPGLHVQCTLLDTRGGRAAVAYVPFIWHPQQHRYGANVKVPQSGQYLLQVHVDPPTFVRSGKEEGHRYLSGVDTSFERVKIEV